MIPESAIVLIETWRLGFIATADAEGRPNLSPKGTFVVIDDETLGFAEMRSPGTVANIASRPEVEVNFVDILTRRGVRMRGRAAFHGPETETYARHLPAFTAYWADLEDMFNGIVLIEVDECRPLQSPVYERGADPDALTAVWLEKIKRITS